MTDGLQERRAWPELARELDRAGWPPPSTLEDVGALLELDALGLTAVAPAGKPGRSEDKPWQRLD